MKKRENGFRGKFFGGFNRRDVVDYIEKLSAERNAFAEENEKLRSRIEELEARGFGGYIAIPAEKPEPPAPAPEKAPEGKSEQSIIDDGTALKSIGALFEDLHRRYGILGAETAQKPTDYPASPTEKPLAYPMPPEKQGVSAPSNATEAPAIAKSVSSMLEDIERRYGLLNSETAPKPMEYAPPAEKPTPEKAPDYRLERAQAEAAEIVEKAGALLEDLERRYGLFRADIEVGTSHVRCEMDTVAERFAAINEALRSVGEGISALRAELGSSSTKE